ncbi:MAG: GPR1/FUN34/YaaH family transporter [Acidobacteriia bacterium]|nr:GPR1/FUN34/YaaH family transporter [Terriglobia bacterium]
MAYEEYSAPPAANAQISLQPIAAPSILGLYGFAGATFMVAANMAHWFGNGTSPLYLFPFAAMFGGLAQFLAGMWAFKARDGIATAMHGMWGAFWMAYGILQLMISFGRIQAPTGAWPEIGYWFIVLAAITWVGAAAAGAENKGLVTLLTLLAAGSTVAAAGHMLGSDGLMVLAGYLFILSAIAAWYTASALMLSEAFGHEVWSVGKSRHVKEMPPISIGAGEPGVIKGQA